MKKVLDFIVYSNFFIALCCVALTLQTALIFEELNDSIFEYALINFLATFCLYNLQRIYYSSKQNENPKYSWYVKNRRLTFTLIALLILLSYNFLREFFIENKAHLIIYSSLSVLSILYFLPPVQLKKYGVLKPFLISFVFVVIAILIPLNFKLTQQTIFYTLSQFFFINSLCILFDVRDIESDQKNNVHTFPILLGINKTKLLTYTLAILYLVFGIISTTLIIKLIIMCCLLIIITLVTSSKRPNYFYQLVVDGLILIQFLIIFF